MTHTLKSCMDIPLKVEDVFSFFCDAFHLELITPPELRFHILTPRPIRMSEGTLIDYRLQLFGFPFKWRTVISLWEPPFRFVDEQLEGPYGLWVHNHVFEEHAGGTTIKDEVHYRLPLQPLGEIAYPFVRNRLEHIFRFRQEAVKLFISIDSGRLS